MLNDIAALLQGVGQNAPEPAATNPLLALLHGAANGGPAAPSDPGPAPQHHGMFGLHGNLRDIIGGLGDAFLVQGGNKPGYSIQREQEEEGDAMRGFTQNPMAAIDRLAEKNPELAAKIYDQYQQNTGLNRVRGEQYNGLVHNRTMQLLRTATPQNYPQVKAMAQQYAASRGYELPFDLPDAYDEKTIGDMVNTAVPVGTLNTQEQKALYNGQMMTYRNENLGERRGYHNRMAGVAETRAENDTRRTDQGEVRTANDTRRTDQGATRVVNDTRRTDQGDARIKQGDRALDQYDNGTRGNTRRPAPTNLRHRTLPGGQVQVQRLVNGKWTDVR